MRLTDYDYLANIHLLFTKQMVAITTKKTKMNTTKDYRHTKKAITLT